jgi:hypothetical protein
MIKIFLSIVCFTLIFSSCDFRNPNDVLRLQKNLLRHTKKIIYKAGRFTVRVEQAFQSVDALLKRQGVDYHDVPRKWKTELYHLDFEYQELNDAVNNVEADAKIYFMKLKALPNQMKTPHIKALEKKANDAYESQWNEMHTALRKNLSKLSNHVYAQGDDFHKALLAVSMRQNTENGLIILNQLRNEVGQEIKLLHKNIDTMHKLVSALAKRGL